MTLKLTSSPLPESPTATLQKMGLSESTQEKLTAHYGQRILTLLEGRLAKIEAEPTWSGWQKAIQLLQEDTPLPDWQIKLFRTIGELEWDSSRENSKEELCKCTGLTRGECLHYIEEGASSVEEIAKLTQATETCGGCIPLIEELLSGNKLILAEVVDTSRLNEEITQVKLRPLNQEVQEAEAGQHILVQGRVDEEWVTRAYTLTASSSFYEIVVKKEEKGRLSSWLHDPLNENQLLRITPPQGQFTLKDQEEKVVFFAGGIGITPALAMIRSQAHRASLNDFHLDWSVKERTGLVFHQELNYWQERLPQVSWSYRISSETGRLQADQISEQYPYLGTGNAYVCGPEGFVAVVHDGLKRAGWPETHIHQELFSSIPQKEIRETIEAPQIEVLESPIQLDKPVGYFPFEEAPAPENQQGGQALSETQQQAFHLQPLSPKQAHSEAREYLELFAKESGKSVSVPTRWKEMETSFFRRGTYAHTYEELAFGARVAWRNSTRCIGRFFWDKLKVRDLRHLTEPSDIFQALLDHLKMATHKGNILPVISIFSPEQNLTLWNGQLIQYAGYRQADGSIIGDPANVELTERIMDLGWPGGERTPFDILPLVIQEEGKKAHWFDIPPHYVLQVPISHPRFDWFKDLGLQWYAVPAVSNMALDLGGIQYTFAPFNGFYMGTEIGARNLSDPYRYNQLPRIAERMGLDTSASYTLWKDSALLELNIAVLHSFKKQGVRMMDHHSLSEFFLKFDQEEEKQNRDVHADWTWLVPPISGSSTEIFHMEKWENKVLKPNYYYMEPGWQKCPIVPSPMEEKDLANCPFHQQMAMLEE